MVDKDLKDSELYEACHQWKERRANSRFYIVLMLIVAFMFGFRGFWVSNFKGVEVSGSSMYATLENGDRLLMRTVGAEKAERGDVIVVYVGGYPECADVGSGLIIKRLIAVAGDEVRCKEGVLEVKYKGTDEFVVVEEPYARYTSLKDKKAYNFEYAVAEGEIFFLGDNRNNSRDSRYGIEGGSHLEDSLYKAEDICGVVPDWAIRYKNVLERVFF
jgi:signal peptidase I